MEKKKKIRFELPVSIKHQETKKLILGLVKQLNEKEMLELSDIPQLHRMATAYETYLICVDILSKEGLTMKNLKNETVKRPEANLLKESWSQYLELAKEYGLTAKSKSQLRGLTPDDEETPLDKFIRKGAKEKR